MQHAEPTREQDETVLVTLRLRDSGVRYRDIAALYPERTRDAWIGLHFRIRSELEVSEG